MDNTTLNLSSLTMTDACNSNRNFEFAAHATDQGPTYFRSIIVKETIRKALETNMRKLTRVYRKDGSLDIDQSKFQYGRAVLNYMNSRFAETGIANWQVRQVQVVDDWYRVMRYLWSENRYPEFPESKVIKIADGLERTVKPDVAFTCGNHVDLVMFKTGKPTFTQTGKKGQFNRDMQLYALVKYGREMGYNSICASFYFLKKNSDTSDWNSNAPDFGGDNIVSMEDIYYPGTPDNLDEEMQKNIEMMQQGVPEESMTTEDCAHCRNYDLCKYTLPPLRVESSSPEGASSEADWEPVPPLNYSDDQKKVINFNDGVLRVIAAAGSGKTQTLAGRVARLIKEGTNPADILCITFSNAGAKEMKHKIVRILGYEPEGLEIRTFHAFEFEIIKNNWKQLGFSRELSVIQDAQRDSIINEILADNPIYEWRSSSFLNYTSKQKGKWGALQIVSDIFTQMKKLGTDSANTTVTDIDSSEYSDMPAAAIQKVISLFDLYVKKCKALGLVDFDDMELLAFKVIENDPDYLSNTYNFEHIIVDEFQDTSTYQMELLKHLKMMKSFKSLMVVGDDAQSIYGFRATSPEFIINFDELINEPLLRRTDSTTVLPTVRQDSVTDISLIRNYRSYQEILDAASKVLGKNKNQLQKTLVAERGNGGLVAANGQADFRDEVKYIVDAIKSQHDGGRKYEDIAVLAYTKNELKAVMDALTKENIPSMFAAPEPLSENPRVRAILAFAKVVKDPMDSKNAAICANALYRAEDTTVDEGLMDLDKQSVDSAVSDMREIAEEVKAEMNPVKQKQLFMDYVSKIALDDEAVTHFAEAFENMDVDEIIKYCHDFEMFGADEEFRRLDEYPGVKLITAHSSKGLEWPVVYLMLDKFAAKRDEETRRLMFVSMTRARDELYITGRYFLPSVKIGQLDSNWCLAEAYEAIGQQYHPVPPMFKKSKGGFKRK